MKGSRPLSEQEIQRVADSFEGTYRVRDRALFILGTRSGYRISELLSLKVNDVYADGHITERITVQRRNMKGHTESRSVVTNSQAKDALIAWIDSLQTKGQLEPDSFLFRSRVGGNRPISRMEAWRVLNKAFRKTGLKGKLGTHVMRKSFADRVYERLGKDLFRTKIALGHKYIDSTIRYLSFKQEDIDLAITAIGETNV